MNDNDELLTWAAQNITEWDDDYTHLRSDNNEYNSLFYTSGVNWYSSNSQWECDGEQYTIKDEDGFCTSFSTKTPQVITKQQWLDATASKNAISSSCKPVLGHIHAKLMAEYAEVAKTNPEPWREFEGRPKTSTRWQELDDHPGWLDIFEYRRKPSPPKTMTIGGIVVEAWPLEELQLDNIFFCINLWHGLYEVEEFRHWNAASAQGVDKFLKAGYIFSTEEQAQAVADALNKLYNDALVGWKAV